MLACSSASAGSAGKMAKAAAAAAPCCSAARRDVTVDCCCESGDVGSNSDAEAAHRASILCIFVESRPPRVHLRHRSSAARDFVEKTQCRNGRFYMYSDSTAGGQQLLLGFAPDGQRALAPSPSVKRHHTHPGATVRWPPASAPIPLAIPRSSRLLQLKSLFSPSVMSLASQKTSSSRSRTASWPLQLLICRS